jgi:hypothetical protein
MNFELTRPMEQKVLCYGTILILTTVVLEMAVKTPLTLKSETGCPSAEGGEVKHLFHVNFYFMFIFVGTKKFYVRIYTVSIVIYRVICPHWTNSIPHLPETQTTCSSLYIRKL